MSVKKWPILDIRTGRPAVKAKTWKSHNMACFLCVIPLLEPVLV